ncbi:MULTISPECIES: hypothetical protein [unclassified Cobetia]|uniref:hypothetical protein n=1 Tax=unclassified Cobetia TaxID=2609414 RepID=UPI0020970A36|nr:MULTISPECIES: hypothetical protein [unclassified Cobetia]MCO7231758.1 hypothetical protein [Cobetia sp. Dlab-2-AX]MCO7234926.1 hypothetical protein [Cobetia sp. Dlab-2-U]
MEKAQNKKMALGFAILIAVFAGLYWLITSLWSWFATLNSDLAVGMLTASSTIIVATVTLVLGRYLERVKEAESHLRSQKIEMYDDFLKQFFFFFIKKEKRIQKIWSLFFRNGNGNLLFGAAPMF